MINQVKRYLGHKRNVVGGSTLLIAQLTQHGFKLIIGIWTAKTLTQGEYGAFSLMMTMLSYITFTNIGIPQSIMFKLPLAIAKGDKDEVSSIPSILYSYLIVMRSILFFAFIVMAFYGFPLNNITMHLEWGIFGGIVIVTGWNALFENMFMSHQKFIHLGISRISRSVVYFIGIALLLSELKLNGILIASLIAGLFPLSIGLYENKKYLKFNYDLIRLGNYIKFGLPITLSSFAWVLISNSTIWVVSLYYPKEYTGIFGFAMLIATIFKVFPGILGEMTRARYLAYLGKLGDSSKKHATIVTSQGGIAWSRLNIPFAIYSLLVLRVLVVFWLPKYDKAWPIMLFIVLGYYCYNISSVPGNRLIHKGKSILLLKINIIILMLQLLVALLIATYSTVFRLIGIAPMFGLITSSISILYIEFYDGSKFFNIGREFWNVVRNMLLGVIIIVITWHIISLNNNWQWMLAVGGINLAIAGPFSIYGLRVFKEFWNNITNDRLK